MSKEYLIVTLAIFGALAAALYFWRNRRTKPTDSIEILIMQAEKLRWKQVAKVEKDGDGATWTQQSIRFARGNEEAIVWNKDATVTLVRVDAPPTFESFLELGDWIARNPNVNDDDTNPEIIYLREITKFVIRHGHFLSLLEVEATDEKFFYSTANLKKAGFATKEDPIIIAALILDALKQYEKDRNRALAFLARKQIEL